MKRSIILLEKNLEKAQEKVEQALHEMQNAWGDETREMYWNASDELLTAERALAKEKGEQYAEPFNFPLTWDRGAPTPCVIQNESKAVLTFYLFDPDPEWDGSYVNVVNPLSKDEAMLGLVEFDLCFSARLGHPNDEVLEGHPLHSKSLEGYTAQIVHNSEWLEEVKRINSVHQQHDQISWDDIIHYVFWFHDSTFECLAKSFRVETHKTTMSEILCIAKDKLFERHR